MEDLEGCERIWVKVCAVPGVEAVGDDILGLAIGFDVDDGVEGVGGARSEKGAVGGGGIAGELDPGKDAIVKCFVGFPGAVGFVAGKGESVPGADNLPVVGVAGGEFCAHVRAGVGGGA